MSKQLANSREEFKLGKGEEPKRASRLAGIGQIPLWLRFVIFVSAVIICFIAGAMTGYSGLGDGRVMDVFKPSTWTHIYDLVEKK